MKKFQEETAFKYISYHSSRGHFVWSMTIHALLVEGIMRNMSVKLFRILTSGSEEDAV